jgi:cytochrome P450
MEQVTGAAGSAGAMPEEWYRDHFDYLSPDLAPGLHPTLARMREGCPVAHSDEYGGYWVVTKYEDVLAVAQNWEAFSSAHVLSVSSTKGVVRNLPVEADPPEQRVFKRLINPYFTPAAVAKWEEPTRALVTHLIDQFIEQGSCDFMDDFARPYPSLAFFTMAINAPEGDLEHVAKMASKSSTPNDPAARESWMGLYAWIKEFVQQRQDQPDRGDVVDGVRRAIVDGRPITEDEIIGTVQLLILGGLETTAGALGLMFDRFCRQPEIAELLRSRPELIPGAVEELLRLDGSFLSVARTAVRDVELGGHAVKTGDKVLLYWASANRDEDEFDDPDEFQVDRSRNRHMAFGVGPHRCAGSNLARLNLRVALEEVLQRLHDIRLQDGADVHYHSTLTRSPLHLPITFTPGPRRGATAG